MRTLAVLTMVAVLFVANPARALRRRAFRVHRARAALMAALALATLSGCSALGSPEARMANAIVNGAACGYAAANGTPCTSEEVLAALARDAEAQRAKVEAVLPQAAAVDPYLTKRLVEELERNTGSNESLVKAILLLASRAASAPPTSSSPPASAPASSPPSPSDTVP